MFCNLHIVFLNLRLSRRQDMYCAVPEWHKRRLKANSLSAFTVNYLCALIRATELLHGLSVKKFVVVATRNLALINIKP